MTQSCLDYELEKTRKRYSASYDGLVRLIKYARDQKNTAMLAAIKRMLTANSDDFFGALGLLDEEYSFGYEWDSDPLARIDITLDIISYQILDDGDPAVGWHKYESRTGKMVPVDKEDGSEYPPSIAYPFFHCNREVLQKTKPDTPPLTFEDIVWVLDWHTKHRRGRYKDEHDEYLLEEDEAKGTIECMFDLVKDLEL